MPMIKNTVLTPVDSTLFSTTGLEPRHFSIFLSYKKYDKAMNDVNIKHIAVVL